MEPEVPASPESSASDSESYNTESARLYFGPLKTPERKFVASSKHLFPPVQTPPLRRSPRLSSPRPRSVTPVDAEDTAEENEDIERVAQLVNGDEEDDEDTSNSQSGTPQRGDITPDEPSSALAERISHAPDNPSPPPSPPAALTLFDPLHTSFLETSGDYQADLMSLRINDGTEGGGANSLVAFTGTDPPSLLMSAPIPTRSAEEHLLQRDLISFDSFTDIPAPVFPDNDMTLNSPYPAPQQALSVDDMFSHSPNRNTPGPQEAIHIPVLIVEPPKEVIHTEDECMAVDAYYPKETAVEMEHDHIPPTNELIQPQSHESEQMDVVQPAAPQASLGDELMTTPLRRSMRPRRSVSPHPLPAPLPVFVPPSPSPARTQVKKRVTNMPADDEIVSDSQDEGEGLRASPSRTTPTSNRIRQRSPGKAPLSFHRALGSLSPTSANVLSTLAFSADQPSTSNTESLSSSNPPSMFSFSVFSAEASAAPSTPVRSDGPIRFSSPSKGSPSKLQLQTPAPNDPTNTPARRIPMEQAIAQGHVSPEKAAQLGFKASINGTTLPSVSTPARRVLISERTVVPLSKSSTVRPASPLKAGPVQRERSAEPSQRVMSSLKGKERAGSVTQDLSSSVIKPGQLPFPIALAASVVSSSVASPSSAPSAARSAVDPPSSPAKSSLKQVTSRIPRIGAKPYARTVDQKATEKAKSTIPRMVDLSKVFNLIAFDISPVLISFQSAPKPKVMESVTIIRRGVNKAPESNVPSASSSSRVKPTIVTSTTLLKRKREAERSPVKPRLITLRQVPPMQSPSEPSSSQIAPAPSTSAVSSKSKKPSGGTIRIRRVPDPLPKPPVVPQPNLPEILTPVEPGATIIVSKPRSPPQEQSNEKLRPVTLEPEVRSVDNDHLPPGSPMKQDPPQNEHEKPARVAAPAIVVTDTTSTADSNVISGLRRTTRSRRIVTHDVIPESSSRSSTSRRKAAVSFHSDDVFSSMSITALKDLTTSNTVKNQQYLSAKLETEVIRREGLRPESPAVKIRTISQRQEEKERRREERAQRRARRSDEMTSSDVEPSSDIGYSSPCEEESSDKKGESLMKHQRGAGDEDDYETPERPDCRRRLFDDRSTPVPQSPVRRVQWDRGLFTTVYIDEVKLGSRQTLKENRDLKGILAPTAKALRLDMLGNLLQVDTPLTDLVQENITVKKFVYDNDIPVRPPPPVAKSTRSKGKKK
ncbi:unnamed protein product [Cyclocybe aegerita]|uniref:Uncharacterized protein n=1 Tax=Cyclocybe aegerita TaxID=1973307 RepID=A0A8S0X2I2_CYCAE|nr:unnamed protein product [Cyclocybe aegerita]